MDAERLILSLDEVGGGDLAAAGGKGANLGELRRAGFPVPPGFVASTAAYRRFAAQNGLNEVIARDLQEGDDAAIRSAFERAPIPPEIESELRAAYRRLGGGPVAVRSSATAEDLPTAAFAGQQDTYLNVTGEEALLDAVRRCWASLWTGRAIAYRQRQQIDPQDVALAVVVQRMIPAEAAGVLFTANPVTGARDESVVDASPGLGEAVVSGLVTPDHFTLRKGRLGWRIAGRSLGRREVVIQPRAGGGVQHLEGQARAAIPSVPGRVLYRLARLGEAIARHFGRPQDIEWAWAGGELYILQARPITALPEPLPEARGPIRMLLAIFAEMFPVRPYPLDLTTWTPAISGAVEPMFTALGFEPPALGKMFIVEDGVAVRFNEKVSLRPTPGVLLAPLRLLALAFRYDPARWQADPLLASARQRARLLEATSLPSLSWEELAALVEEAMALPHPLAGEMRRRYIPRAVAATGLLRLLLGLLGEGDRLGALMSGTGSETVQANRALEALAGEIRADPSLAALFSATAPGGLRAALEQEPAGQAFLSHLQGFLEQYGHRELVLSTALQPTWKDDPQIVLGMLKGLAQAEAPAGRGPAEWEVARDRVLAHPWMGFTPLRLAFLRLLAGARRLWELRESTHFEATRILPTLRRALLEMGGRLAQAGALQQPEDVFHLTFGELKQAGVTWPPGPSQVDALRSLVQRRKERRQALEGTPVIDPRLYRLPELEGENAGDVLLRGTPGSPGQASGPARVIRSAAEFDRLKPGEVLVAPYTNPAWTPLFQRAAAVVVDGGGPGSHAAIVAREYGIPAVMGVVDGTALLKDGQIIRVDGSRGQVVKVG